MLTVFFRVGATGFGGAMAMLGVIQVEAVQKRHWVTPQVFADGVTLGQVLPGPIAVDTVAYLGYRLHGWPGAILSVIAFILPSFLLVLALTLAYLQYGSLPQVSGVFKGIGAAVVALVLAAAYRMGTNAVKDLWSALLLVGAAVALAVFQVNIVLIVVVAGLAGFLLYRNAPVPSSPGPGRMGPGGGIGQGRPGAGGRPGGAQPGAAGPGGKGAGR
jgi:chromate transporter